MSAHPARGCRKPENSFLHTVHSRTISVTVDNISSSTQEYSVTQSVDSAVVMCIIAVVETATLLTQCSQSCLELFKETLSPAAAGLFIKESWSSNDICTSPLTNDRCSKQIVSTMTFFCYIFSIFNGKVYFQISQ